MKRLAICLLALAVGAWCATELAGLARAWQRAPFELGRGSRSLSQSVRARLGALDGDVLATYYVTRREHMPSSMRRLEDDVTALFAEMQRAAPGRLRFQVLDPAERPELAGYLAHRGIAPQRVRTVLRDAWSEREVHSTLVLAYAGRPEARITGLRPEHVPALQELVAAHLAELEAPTRPQVAVAGAATEKLARHLEGLGAEVLRLDFDAEAELPASLDALFWIAPARASAAHARALELLLERGASAVVAGSAARLELERGVDPPRLARLADDPTVGRVLGEFALRAAPGLVLDEVSEVLSIGGRELPAPWRVLAIAPNQDFRGFAGQPNDTLLFDAPTAWRHDPARLAELGWDARTLVSTSGDTWIQELAEPAALAAGALAPERGRPVAPQALGTWLVPRDPWRGSLAAFGSAAPFQDEAFDRANFGHPRLAATLVATLASAERRVARRVELAAPLALPALSARARFGWRAWILLGAPLALGLAAALGAARSRRLDRRRDRQAGPRGGARRRWPRLAPAAVGAACALAFTVLWRSAPLPAWRADLTAGDVHTLAPATRALAAAFGRPVDVELLFTHPLPAGLRAGLLRLKGKLADLERAGLALDVHATAAEDLDPAARAELARAGIEPLSVSTATEEVQSVRSIFAHAILRSPAPDGSGERRVVLDFPAALAFDDLEFRLAAALWQLERGRAPRALVVSTPARLAPAEAHVLYRTRGLFAPAGGDAFALVPELLRLAGFEVLTVDPNAPDETPGGSQEDAGQGAELLVWLQPRRPIEPMLARLARHLRAGKGAIVAAQHYEIETRPALGSSAGLAFRPQPLYADLETGWLAELGLALVEEVLCDAHFGQRTVRRVEPGSQAAEISLEEIAQPFLVRASSAGFDAESGIVRALGDLLFAAGNRFALDEAKLARAGLAARALVSTSPAAWSSAWSGGDLPGEVLRGPGAAAPALGAPAPLAVLVSGRFPPIGGATFGPDAAPPARLLLVGASTPFQSELLFDPRYDHAHFLANAAADLALGPDYGAIMARRAAAPGFAPPSEALRLGLRAGVLAALPLGLLALALARLARHGRARPARRAS